MRYRRRSSPLHAARAGVGACYCLALALAAVIFDHPLLLAALALAVAGAAVGAGVGRPVVRALLLALPVAAVAALLNPLFAHQGLTVLARLGQLPWFGELDVTLESVAFGADQAAKLLVIVPALALAVNAVDPDELLRLARRVSFRSALTTSLGIRMWTVLERDGRRMGEAQRTRPGSAAGTLRGRTAIVRAVATNALDRAVDVAATLELRGYGVARRGRRAAPRRWSRHDLAFCTAAAAIVTLVAGARLAGLARFDAYPLISVPMSRADVVLATALVLVALAPFADRRGIE